MGKRRGRGEGAIFQRGSGLWVARIDIGYDAKGKRRRREVYGKTKAEVREKLMRLQSEALTGVSMDVQRMTVGQFLDRWLADWAKSAVRETTYQLYEGLVRNHLKPRIGGVQIAKLTPMHIQAMYAAMERAGTGATVRRNAHACLRGALNQGLKWGIVQRNVCDAVDKPRMPKAEMKVWTAEEVGVFLEASKDERLYPLYVVALTTGLRQGELLALHWKDIDLRTGTIAVQASLSEIKGRIYRSEPKSASARRHVNIPEFAIAALKKHRVAMLAEGNTGSWVFCTQNGTPYRKSWVVGGCFMRVVTKAGLPRIRFHDLRHTAATLLLKEGIHPKIVQERLGHSQISLTLDTYSHVLPSMQKEATSKLDLLFDQIVGK